MLKMNTFVAQLMAMTLVAAIVPYAHGGACCFDNGTECMDVPELMCNMLDGTWMGEATSCDSVDCDLGACCILDIEYVCWDNYPEESCELKGGDFLGPLSTCNNEGSFCQSIIGACCIDGNECWDWVSEEECYWMSGEFIGQDTDCGDAPWCVTYYGSCCFGDSCEDGWEHDSCEWSGGIFWIDPCEMLQDVEMCVPSGACCLTDGSCLQNVAQDYCHELGGEYYGDGTSDCFDCTPMAACCIDDECYMTNSFIDCIMSEGDWLQGETCDSDPCPDACVPDLNDDGMVGVDDLLALLDAFGDHAGGDCNGDKQTDVDDLLILIGAFGPC